jgi:acyl-CoA thioesterase FadM
MNPSPIDAPLSLHTGQVHSGWIDYNQHMSEGYYGVAFGEATDAFMDFAGLDEAYRVQSKCTIYTVETHITFLRELKVGTSLQITTHVLGFDAKRIHIFHEMFQAEAGYLAATMEAMLLHVDDTPRTTPLPPDILTRVDAIYQAHKNLPRSPQAGRRVSLAKDKQN